MKKLIAVSIILVLFSGMAFAQMAEGLKLGASGRMMVIPLEVTTYNGTFPDDQDKDRDLAAAGIGSAGFLGDVRMNLSGGTEFVGFNFQAYMVRDTIKLGDNMNIWTQPFEWLRLDLGLFKEHRLRGKVGTGEWGAVTLAYEGEDAIFTRFAGVTGALLSIIPNENIYFGAMVPAFVNLPSSALAQAPANGAVTGPAKTVYEKVQIAAGYTLDDIGLIRAQYVGGADEAGTAKRIEFAFTLTAIENLTAELGAKIYMPFTQRVDSNDPGNKTAINQAHQVNLAANYTMDDLGILARVTTRFGEQVGADKYIAPFIVNFHLVPSYNLGFATVGLDFGLEAASAAKVDGKELTDISKRARTDFGMGVWLQKNLGKGYLKGGVSFSYDDAQGVTQVPHGYIRIPIVAQFSL